MTESHQDIPSFIEQVDLASTRSTNHCYSLLADPGGGTLVPV